MARGYVLFQAPIQKDLQYPWSRTWTTKGNLQYPFCIWTCRRVLNGHFSSSVSSSLLRSQLLRYAHLRCLHISEMQQPICWPPTS